MAGVTIHISKLRPMIRAGTPRHLQHPFTEGCCLTDCPGFRAGRLDIATLFTLRCVRCPMWWHDRCIVVEFKNHVWMAGSNQVVVDGFFGVTEMTGKAVLRAII